MKIRLNEKKVADLKPAQVGYEVRDELVRGLILRVGKKGQKVWEIMTFRGSKRLRVRLGTFPGLSVKEARKKAEAAKEVALSPLICIDTKTVEDLFASYKAAKESKMRSWRDVQSVWDNWALPRIGHVRVADISVHHGLDLRDYVASQSSEIRAGAVIRYLRPMFAWAADERIISAHPWAGLKAGATAEARDRVLTSLEWTSLWQASFSEEYPLGPFARALMLSAQRLTNVASMRWDEIHGDVWTIPRQKMKATRTSKASAHEVPLSKALANLIAEQPQIGPFVFTTRGDRPIMPGSRLKNRLGSVAGFGDWRFHDVRRSAATVMTVGNSDVKVPRFIVERVLGHADTSVTAVYDRASYREEKREALEVLAASVTLPF
ncbi:tyrosine-type recombinase/integrase [Candidatus Halocynthiibacter alkanivorans]|uniref:tyrosine-type recombinase/integrase n=1 Tax=Candidatus Halocynthiibacter alkanivorans TaxID=2267619 RepID=UPI000DF22698|nr:tyrosine-type recombinase/integrase [Candidatus Halocynthiibacter alkanivorans]